MRPGDFGDLFRSAFGHDDAAARSAFGSHVDHPVGRLDDVEIMFDNQHGVALVDQGLKHGQQLGDVLEMQTGGWFVQDVDRPTGLPLLQFTGQLDALGFAA